MLISQYIGILKSAARLAFYFVFIIFIRFINRQVYTVGVQWKMVVMMV